MDKKVFNFYSKIEFPEEHRVYLHSAEDVAFSVKTIRDKAIFTNKRILIVDKQGITGKKVEYFSIPFKNIVSYAIETAGTFDLDSEIKLILTGGIEIELKFLRGADMSKLLFEVYHLINDYVISHS